MLASDLLLALDEKLQVDRHARACAHARLDSFHVHVDLSLVVDRATGIQASVSNRRFEGRRRPQVDRILGLNIVVPVDEKRRCRWIHYVLGEHHRVPGRRYQLGVLQTSGQQLLPQPLGGPLYVSLVGAVRAYTGNAQPLPELAEEAVQVLLDIVAEVRHLSVLGFGIVAVRFATSAFGISPLLDELTAGPGVGKATRRSI